jgi:hypothetical protein
MMTLAGENSWLVHQSSWQPYQQRYLEASRRNGQRNENFMY